MECSVDGWGARRLSDIHVALQVHVLHGVLFKLIKDCGWEAAHGGSGCKQHCSYSEQR